MTMVITWSHLWSSFADHCSGHCGVRVKARHQVLSVGSAENGEEDEEKDRSRNGMCFCSYLCFILNLLPRKALTLTNIVPNEITKGGLGCMSSLYNRTCGWVCLESLIFPCLVFVLVLGGGAFPPFSIPSWSGRFSLLFLRRHQKTSHHIRCPDFPLFFILFDIILIQYTWYYNLCWIFHTLCFSKFGACTSFPWSSRTYLSSNPVLSSVCGFVFFQENLPSKTPWLDT